MNQETFFNKTQIRNLIFSIFLVLMASSALAAVQGTELEGSWQSTKVYSGVANTNPSDEVSVQMSLQFGPQNQIFFQQTMSTELGTQTNSFEGTYSLDEDRIVAAFTKMTVSFQGQQKDFPLVPPRLTLFDITQFGNQKMTVEIGGEDQFVDFQKN